MTLEPCACSVVTLDTFCFFFSSRRRHTRSLCDWSSDVCSSDLLVWMSTFGGTALFQAENGIGELANGISDVSLAMFHMLEQLPMTSITSTLAIILDRKSVV